MLKNKSNILLNIAAILLVAMFFSCGNKIQEVEDFLADKNLPVGEVKNVYLIHTDSGRIKTKLIAPLMLDYFNRKEHPYSKFPDGIKIVTFDKKSDSVILTADYSVSFNKTNISEVKGNVVVVNEADGSKLMTDQLFWDANEHYIYTEKRFVLISNSDTIKGIGFESNEDLSKVNMKDIYDSQIYMKENQ